MSNATSAKPSNAPHILLVDDNKMGLSARRNVLEELGYAITPFTCAKDALAAFAERSFDLIVTDYKMLKMDGIEFISSIRKQKPDMPIILISGFADTLGLDEKSTGADVVIQKSNHEVPNLIRSVHRLLSRKPHRKPAVQQQAEPKPKRKIL